MATEILITKNGFNEYIINIEILIKETLRTEKKLTNKHVRFYIQETVMSVVF